MLYRRPLPIHSDVPIISFTFDDFPKSALLKGGAILKRFGAHGTYYAALGLMGKETPTGSIFVAEDLKALVEAGHDLGCHTYAHCHSAETRTSVFVDSIIENARVLENLVPGVCFQTHSYPISAPKARTKLKASKHFLCCRGGGQTLNHGVADLNHLSAFFLEQSRDNLRAVSELIERNRQAKGWLIFATHDVSETPTQYGCTPEFFEEVVECAANSGARILPVTAACRLLLQLDPQFRNGGLAA